MYRNLIQPFTVIYFFYSVDFLLKCSLSCFQPLVLVRFRFEFWSGSDGSVLAGLGPDAGAADGHRLVRRGVAAFPVLPVQHQDVLVDGDWVQVVSVFVSRVWTGAEAAAALGLPEGGRDPVLHRGRPEPTTATELIVSADLVSTVRWFHSWHNISLLFHQIFICKQNKAVR